jgi:hypothetical protein
LGKPKVWPNAFDRNAVHVPVHTPLRRLIEKRPVQTQCLKLKRAKQKGSSNHTRQVADPHESYRKKRLLGQKIDLLSIQRPLQEVRQGQ